MSRLYSDQEISAILKRAGEMQATQRPEETHGLSLEELKHIAAEVGLSPEIVAAAAAELEHSGIEEKSTGLLGAPTSLHIERVLPGEITRAQMADVAAKIGQSFDMVGKSAEVGDALEWTHTSERNRLQVTVMPQEGQTKVRVVGKFSGTAMAFFLPSLMVGGVWSAMIPLALEASPAVAFSIAVIGFMIGYMGARFGYSAYIRKKERATEKLLRELDQMINKDTARSQVTESKLKLPEEEEVQAAMKSRERVRE